MLRVGAAEPVDGLGVVADAGQPRAVGPQQPDDVGLNRVHVLVLIDKHRVEHPAQNRARGGVRERGPPEQQQVVEIDKPVPPLVRDVGAEHLSELARDRGAPGKPGLDHVSHRLLRVHAPGVDVGAYPGSRRSTLRADQPVVAAEYVKQIRDVARIDDGELGRQRERLGIPPDDPVRDRVKRAAPDPSGGRPVRCRCASGGCAGRREPGQHLFGRTPGERQQQDPGRIHSLVAQPASPRGQRPGLSRSRPRQHQQRSRRPGGGVPLLLIEAV